MFRRQRLRRYIHEHAHTHACANDLYLVPSTAHVVPCGGVSVYCTCNAACASLELAAVPEHLSSPKAPGKTFLMKALNMRPPHIKLTKHMHILEISIYATTGGCYVARSCWLRGIAKIP